MGKNFLFLRETEKLSHLHLCSMVIWKAEKEAVISVVKYMIYRAIQKQWQSNRIMIYWCGSFGLPSTLPDAYANYQWVSSLMICLYKLKWYSPGTPTHNTLWNTHMLLSSELTGKFWCICINCPLLIHMQVRMKTKLIKLRGGLYFDLHPVWIRNNSTEASYQPCTDSV